MKSNCLALVLLSFLCFSSVYAQKESVGNEKYAAAEKKCNQSIEKEDWKIAETLCSAALTFAGQLGEDGKSAKMRAYENYAFTLFSQYKFQQALDNYAKALEIGKSFLTESDAELGYAYFNLGRANQGLSKLEKAQEYYKESEKIYRAAFEKAATAELKNKQKDSIKRTLILQRYVAGLLEDHENLKELEKRLADLEKTKN